MKSISGDIVEPSRNAAVRSGMKPEAVDKAVQGQLNNLHSSQTLSETADELKRLEAAGQTAPTPPAVPPPAAPPPAAPPPAAPPPAAPPKPPPASAAPGGGANPIVEIHPPVPPRPSGLSRAAAWTAEAAPKVLKVAGQVATIVGAWNEADRTYQLEVRNNRGWLNAGLMWTATAGVGIAAGVVDDALAAEATIASGSPAPVMESWDTYGAGPVQHAAGEAIRGILDWGAKHGL